MSHKDLIGLYLAHLREQERTRKTIDEYERTLRAVDRDLPYGLEVANETELRGWIWRDGLTPASRATYFAPIAGFFGWAVDHEELLDFNPVRRINKPKRPRRHPRVATDQQVEIVVTQAIEPYRRFGKLAAYQGLRCIEIHRLWREHINERHLTVHRGKGDKYRRVRTHPIVWADLEPLPLGPITDRASEESISESFRNYCMRKLGIKVSLHLLRGWHATQGYRKTKDLVAVQRDMGHADPATTTGYIDVDDSELWQVIADLPTFGVAAGVVPELALTTSPR